MLLIPTGLEDHPLRRVPWVTLGLIFVNAVVFAFTHAIGAAGSGEVEVLDGLVQKSLEERPYLVPGGRLGALLGASGRRELENGRAQWAAAGGQPAPAQLAREQKDFDALLHDYFAALDGLPTHRFGYVPARPPSWTLLTAMFLHGGWLHLLGNMLFLYVSGIYLEDVYGRALYLASYLLSGVAATLGHYLTDPQSAIPLVGASGAIAGVMGMVLVRLVRSRVRLLFLPILFLPNVRIPLTVPAVLVLPFWLGQQLWFALDPRAESSGGVAWWAHIAGFAFGAALAGGIRVLRIEDRSQGRTVAQDEVQRHVERAAAARLAGDVDRADVELGHALEKDPENVPAWQEAFELALARGDSDDLARAMSRLLEILPKRGGAAASLALLRDERWRDLPERPPRLDLAIAAAYERLGDPARALEHHDAVVQAAPQDPLALRALVKKGELLARLGRRVEARDALRHAQAHPAMSDVWQATIARTLAKLES